jgi:hypothetical protein
LDEHLVPLRVVKLPSWVAEISRKLSQGGLLDFRRERRVSLDDVQGAKYEIGDTYLRRGVEWYASVNA